VFFDPDVYPMNWAWWDGKMSFEHYREDHGLDAETLLQASRTEAEEHAAATSEEVGNPAAATADEHAADEVASTHK